MKGELRVPEFKSGQNWLITARTYLVDRGLPKVERILLPPAVYPGGKLNFSIDNSETVTRSQNLRRRHRIWNRIFGEQPARSVSRNLIVDFRSHHPSNWSHALNSHLPLAFYLQGELQKDCQGRKFDLLFDENIPSYIINIFEYFGFSSLRYSGPVVGQVLEYDAIPFACINAIARDVISRCVISNTRYSELYEHDKSLPKKVFISRKDSRRLINEAEVEALLASDGYMKIYAEDLSIKDQLKLFIHATDIVAIHGAALAPLLFRPGGDLKLNLVEIFTAGHLSSHFRAMADIIGANWIGVRGLIQPRMVESSYNHDRPFTKYSLSSFEVDIESLKLAMEMQQTNLSGLPV